MAPEEPDYLTRNVPTLGLIAAGALLFLTVLAFELARPAPPTRAPAATPRDVFGDDDLGHHVDPIDAAALAAAESVGGAASDPSLHGHAPIDPEQVAAETPAGPAKNTTRPARPKTAARVHCHECGRKQQRADENFCPTCAIAYVCGACGEARVETTGATCGACQARFD